ncbi:hypothetical protein VB776_06465 [Arcicella sp. DC2W]|uniref:Uncharacterized protein n=1 Tax=Arcicella gelida TaxID=2984195 RepID=A0ABU5S2A9_9BACT|nr:hypothetical protein [Arcicella sp. DC2W]MEA5402549.1 hypothetical protein [Arcicella sp. DC2W]
MNIDDNTNELILNTLYKKIGVYEILVDTMLGNISLLEERIKELTERLKYQEKHIDILESTLDDYDRLESGYHKQYFN